MGDAKQEAIDAPDPTREKDVNGLGGKSPLNSFAKLMPDKSCDVPRERVGTSKSCIDARVLALEEGASEYIEVAVEIILLADEVLEMLESIDWDRSSLPSVVHTVRWGKKVSCMLRILLASEYMLLFDQECARY